MEKLNFLGIGPKIGVVTLPSLALAIFLSLRFPASFRFLEDHQRILLFTGLALVITGAAFYLITALFLMKGLKNTKLVTSGTYYLCCNPLYAAIIIFIIPGTSLMMNSWLVLAVSIVAYVLFKVHIKTEYAELRKFFGDEYEKYKAETPEFFPFPIKKWIKHKS